MYILPVIFVAACSTQTMKTEHEKPARDPIMSKKVQPSISEDQHKDLPTIMRAYLMPHKPNPSWVSDPLFAWKIVAALELKNKEKQHTILLNLQKQQGKCTGVNEHLDRLEQLLKDNRLTTHTHAEVQNTLYNPTDKHSCADLLTMLYKAAKLIREEYRPCFLCCLLPDPLPPEARMFFDNVRNEKKAQKIAQRNTNNTRAVALGNLGAYGLFL